MRRLENVTDESIQNHILEAQGITVNLTLYWRPQVESWFADVEYGDIQRNGIRLVVGTLHVQSANMPLDIVVRDNSDFGLDPMRRDDFSTRRCDILVLMPDEMEEIRGAPVPLQ
jgi:hypothetical protein